MIRRGMSARSHGQLRGNACALVAAIVVLGLAACGGSGRQGGGTVRDFRDVQVGDVRVETLPGGTGAVIRVTTDPATVCAVAFGPTRALGRIANDPGMGGTAISRHSVALRNLRPGTTYRYRLTATDATGGVYQTPELRTFRTRPAAAAGAGTNGPDLALGATVAGVSSVYGDAFAASNALDGDLTTEWSSNGDGDDAFLTVDLGKALAVTGVAFRTREMGDGSAITRSFSVLVDGKRRFGPFPAGDRLDARIAHLTASARLFRFDVVSSTGGNTGAAEIEIYGARG